MGKDLGNGAKLPSVADIEGMESRGKRVPGGGPLYQSRKTLLQFFAVVLWRMVVESPKVDLFDVLILPEGALLSVGGSAALLKRGVPKLTPPLTAAMRECRGDLDALLRVWQRSVQKEAVAGVLLPLGYDDATAERVLENLAMAPAW